MDDLSVNPAGLHSPGVPARKARAAASSIANTESDLKVGSLTTLTQDTVSFGSTAAFSAFQNFKKQFSPKNVAATLAVAATLLSGGAVKANENEGFNKQHSVVSASERADGNKKEDSLMIPAEVNKIVSKTVNSLDLTYEDVGLDKLYAAFEETNASGEKVLDNANKLLVIKLASKIFNIEAEAGLEPYKVYLEEAWEILEHFGLKTAMSSKELDIMQDMSISPDVRKAVFESVIINQNIDR